jgi:uncharacterized membrane protein HdeD (DUF308 family)
MPPSLMRASPYATHYVIAWCFFLALILLGRAAISHDLIIAIVGGILMIAGINFTIQLIRAKRHDAAHAGEKK